MKSLTLEQLDQMFPPTFIVEDTYGHGHLERGIRYNQGIRRINTEEKNILDTIEKKLK